MLAVHTALEPLLDLKSQHGRIARRPPCLPPAPLVTRSPVPPAPLARRHDFLPSVTPDTPSSDRRNRRRSIKMLRWDP